MSELHLSPDTEQAALARVLRSRHFTGAERRRKLLEYLTAQTLAGAGEGLKEFNIGVEVYGRDPASYDPRLDPVVRVDIGRLRAKLHDYYENEGREDPVWIELPKGSYAVIFHQRVVEETEPEPARPAPVEPIAVPRKRHIRGLAIAGVLIAACAGYGFYRLRRPTAGLRSVAVLPFENLTGDPQKGYLADGITEQLTDSLAHISDLRVVARTTAFQFKGKATDIREIGRRLNADAVVEGSLRNMNGRYQLTVQVNRTANGYHIISQTVEGSSQNLEKLENDLVLPVLAALRPGAAVPAHKRVDPEAYDLFLKARARRGDGSRASFDEAIVLLNQAIQRDPTYADAYAALAGVYASGGLNFASEPLAYAQKAQAAASIALRLDPLSAQAYAAQGLSDSLILLEWRPGEEELRNAVRLMPQNATAHNWLGVVLLAQGRFDAAITELRTAQDLDPLPAGPGATLGLAYYMARRYDDALHQFTRVRDLHPGVVAVHPFVGMALEARGDFSQAMAEYQLSVAKMPSVQANIAHLLAVTGKREEAKKLLARIEDGGPGEAPNAFDVAVVYGALGEREQAFQWLDRAYQQRIIWFLKVHPMLDPLRGDPRYARLLREANLASGK